MSAFHPLRTFSPERYERLMETDGNPFADVGAEELDQLAQQRGFKRKGQRKWLRRTADFVQLVNVQGSQWSSED